MVKTSNNMVKKRILISALFVMTIFMFSVSVSAHAPVLVTPASSGTMSGTTYVWNVTNGTVDEMTTCRLWGNSSLTSNSTSVLLNTSTNDSVSAKYINGTFNSALIEDSNDWKFFADCSNGTLNSYNSSTSTSVIVNNTIPDTPTSLVPASESTDTDGAISFSATVNGWETTHCTLFFTGTNPGLKSYSMTHTGNTCTYSLTSSSDQTYKYLIQADDGTDFTNSTETTYHVSTPSSATNQLTPQQLKQAEKEAKALSVAGEGKIPKGVWWIIGIILAIVIIVAIVNKK